MLEGVLRETGHACGWVRGGGGGGGSHDRAHLSRKRNKGGRRGEREEGGREGRTGAKVHDVLSSGHDDSNQDKESRHPPVGHEPVPEEEEGRAVVSYEREREREEGQAGKRRE